MQYIKEMYASCPRSTVTKPKTVTPSYGAQFGVTVFWLICISCEISYLFIFELSGCGVVQVDMVIGSACVCSLLHKVGQAAVLVILQNERHP